MATSSLPADYEFDVYRGDTEGPFTHLFNDDPLDWAAATAYTVGDSEHGPDEVYVASTTVTHDGVFYTCKTAHTSGATFDASFWTVDNAALGPETDISDWTFLAQYRASTISDAPLIASDTCTIADGPGGRMTRVLTAAESALLITTPVYWDLQATKGDGTVKTYLKKDRLKIGGDVSRVIV